MKRFAVCILIVMMLLTLGGCVSPFSENDTVGEYTPEIDPEPGNSLGSTVKVKLWMPLKNRRYFALLDQEISVASGERTEMAVCKALLSQTQPGDILTAPGWNGLSVTDISDDNQTLYVTLSREFLSPPTTDVVESARMAKAAVLSLANTLIGLKEYTQVQFLVEMPTTGKVQRPTRKQAGFIGSDENAVLGLLMQQDELILTPANAVELALNAFESMDSLVLYDILYRTGMGAPDVFAFQTVLQNLEHTVAEHQVLEVIETDETHAVVYVDLTFSDGKEEYLVTRAPLACRRENGVWKVEYTSFDELVLESIH